MSKAPHLVFVGMVHDHGEEHPEIDANGYSIISRGGFYGADDEANMELRFRVGTSRREALALVEKARKWIAGDSTTYDELMASAVEQEAADAKHERARNEERRRTDPFYDGERVQ